MDSDSSSEEPDDGIGEFPNHRKEPLLIYVVAVGRPQIEVLSVCPAEVPIQGKSRCIPFLEPKCAVSGNYFLPVLIPNARIAPLEANVLAIGSAASTVQTVYRVVFLVGEVAAPTFHFYIGPPRAQQ